jgi:hypothetical protein
LGHELPFVVNCSIGFFNAGGDYSPIEVRHQKRSLGEYDTFPRRYRVDINQLTPRLWVLRSAGGSPAQNDVKIKKSNRRAACSTTDLQALRADQGENQ